MKKLLITLMLPLLVWSCKDPVPVPEVPEPVGREAAYELGADIGWITEMESKGYKFYNKDGGAVECTELMKQLGCTAIRHRVWVNPTAGWCGAQDLLAKAKRVQRLGLKLMVDFHYSDWWADPGKQNIPAAWADYSVSRMAQAVAEHTEQTLRLLKDNGIDVAWVQVGNEVNTGMLWPVGRVSGDDSGNFVMLLNSGYQAVKSVYPDAIVILHHSNAQDLPACKWFYDNVRNAGGRYDMIGLSLYPSYWNDSIKGYPDWKPYTQSAVANFKALHDEYKKPVMLVEFGMPASQPDKAEAALQYIIDGTVAYDWFGGVFYWEPESERSRNGYDYGAFADGKATSALNPFKNFKK